MSKNPDLKYRPDIDGLRAIAVLAVLFFHTSVPGFSGGFVGVDIFFVISGFLITSIIVKDIQADRFSIARFYERRIRRIFPALFPVIAFVLVVGTWLFDSEAFKNLGNSITATTLFSSNILFWQESGYFDAPSLLKPLLHTWSLAVEEQFYIFFPIALILIKRYLKSRFIPWISAAFILSLAASILGVSHQPAATFYLVPTRAWELMAGSLLALRALPEPKTNTQRNALALSGIALITGTIALYSEATPFPGLAAIPPVLGSALIIYSGMGQSRFAIQRALSVQPLLFIGLISYSLYLWHWPIVTFAKIILIRKLNGADSALIIVSSIALATFSWKFIEQPFRGAQSLIPDRKRLFVYSGVVMTIMVAAGTLINLRDGMPGRFDRFFPGVAKTIDSVTHDATFEKHCAWEKNAENIGKGAKPVIVGTPSAVPSFALIGDSHARAIIPAIEMQANASGLSGYIVTKSAAPPLCGLSIELDHQDDNFDEFTFYNAVMDFIRTHHEIRTVILVARWSAYIHGHMTEKNEDPLTITFIDKTTNRKYESNTEAITVALKRTVQTLVRMKRNVVLVSDIPEIGYDIPTAYSIHVRLPILSSLDDIRITENEYYNRNKEINHIFEELSKHKEITLIRPDKIMFDDSGKSRLIANGKLLYRDDDHLSTQGALFVAPAFDQLFKTMAQAHQDSETARHSH